ncbi:MAG: response regulator transcription factor [Anaerolineales bacterium]|nr:response regulator transcription factor [Anaerolineales bacterium]
MPTTKILVIDDEPSIVNLVSAYLRPEGYEVYTAADGPAGLKAARAYKPDIIVLDIMLPGMDGIQLLSHLRRESNVYVIMLTARTEETDKIVGLSVGADDYVTKPFSPRELVARIKAALRRLQTGAGSGSESEVLAFRRLRIDVGARQVSVDEHPDPGRRGYPGQHHAIRPPGGIRTPHDAYGRRHGAGDGARYDECPGFRSGTG